MRKTVRNLAILLQNTNLSLTLTHALTTTLTLIPDPNSNPNLTAIPHLYSAFRILPYPTTCGSLNAAVDEMHTATI